MNLCCGSTSSIFSLHTEVMPTTLESLYRFMRYNEEEGPQWSVASCPIESDKRLYRIMYSGNELYEQELTIQIKHYRWELSEYKRLLEIVSRDVEFCEAFRSACMDMLQGDPWLSSIA
jgi:hypothetical protein